MNFTIPLVPPSGNDYKKPDWPHKRFYVTREAVAFKEAVAIFSRVAGGTVPGKYFRVEVHIYLGKRQRLDADNSQKCLLDGMQEGGVFGERSDASVKELHVYIHRDAEEPRTEVSVEAL